MWLEEPYLWEKGKWTVVIDRASAKWLSGEIIEETKDPAARYIHIPFTLRKTDPNIVLAEDHPVPKYVWAEAYKLVARVGADVWGWTGSLGASAPGFGGEYVGIGRDIMERLLPAKQIRKIRRQKLSDEQTAELAIQVWQELAHRIEEALGRGGQEALNRLMHKSNFTKDDTGLTRNNIFKAAHALGIKLPSHMF